MPDIADGQTAEVQGSGAKPYVLRNTGGVYSCSCPAWRNQSVAIERRTCKHLRKYRGEEAEAARCGAPASAPKSAPPTGAGGEEEAPGKAVPPLLLAESWDTAADLTGWWMSEKLDGVRAWWTGTGFLSRLGNPYLAPEWFTAGLPKEPLDGELWLDRKQFQRTVSIARRQDRSDHWRELRFVVFDAPSAGGPFEKRIEAVRDLLAGAGGTRPEFARPHEHVACGGVDHLRAELARVETLGGEGLMLRRPGSLYVAGRSAELLKVKTFHDAEAVVIGHQAGAGRHKGRMGALLARLPDGTEFAVGTGFSDAERSAPPAVGSVITFRYQELTEAGVPRFPSFVGVRIDAAAASPAQGGKPAPSKPGRAKK